jgi:hypothetical protein
MNVEEFLNQIDLPRLQIRCEHEEGNYYQQVWYYELVYRHFTGSIEKVPFSHTECRGGNGLQPIDKNGKLELPFRDGAHIKHDAVHMNLPAYAICDDIVEKLDLQEFKEKFPEKYKS